MSDCIHHWVIESSNGRRHSPGRCLNCGVGREFDNSPQVSHYHHQNREAPTKGATPWRLMSPQPK